MYSMLQSHDVTPYNPVLQAHDVTPYNPVLQAHDVIPYNPVLQSHDVIPYTPPHITTPQQTLSTPIGNILKRSHRRLIGKKRMSQRLHLTSSSFPHLLSRNTCLRVIVQHAIQQIDNIIGCIGKQGLRSSRLKGLVEFHVTGE